MSSEKTDAIILRIVPFSESSVVLTILTRDFGKISALAKGAYRPKSPFEGAIDLGCHCRVVFIKKSSDALDLLIEAKLERRFRAANKSLRNLYAGYYVLELLRELTETGQPQADLFDLALNTLIQIDAPQPDVVDLANLLTMFELQALRLLGHAPSMTDCASCGKEVSESKMVAFGMISGGVLCPQCRPKERSVVSISQTVRSAIRQQLQDASNSLEQYSFVNCDQKRSAVTGELRAILGRYMSHHIGHELKMRRFIDALQLSHSSKSTIR
ncbi:MAG: DNA repair protein RecO [Pirellulaceae bacterium]